MCGCHWRQVEAPKRCRTGSPSAEGGTDETIWVTSSGMLRTLIETERPKPWARMLQRHLQASGSLAVMRQFRSVEAAAPRLQRKSRSRKTACASSPAIPVSPPSSCFTVASRCCRTSHALVRCQVVGGPRPPWPGQWRTDRADEPRHDRARASHRRCCLPQSGSCG